MIPVSPDLAVLNCGAGDMTFSFDENDPLECARAERVVKDMLARGYLLFARVNGELKRVKKFDSKTREYILADGPEAKLVEPAPAGEKPEPRRRGPGRPKKVPAKGTPTVGIAPTAGG